MIAARVLAFVLWCGAVVHAGACLGLRPAYGWPLALLAFGGGGWFLKRRRRVAPSAPRARTSIGDVAGTAFACVLTAGLLARPMTEALATPPTAHDAVFIWTPKTASALVDAPPRIQVGVLRPGETTLEYHPEYPRLFPMIGAALGSWTNPPDLRGLRVAAVLICAAGLLVAYGAAAERRNRAGGWIAVVAIGGLPMFALHASSGYADAVVATCVVLAAVGLTKDADGRMRPWLALGGALGAALTKDEGVFVFAATLALVVFDAARRRSGASFLAACAAAALYAPWLRLKSGAPSRGFLLFESLRQNVGMIWIRAERAAAEIAHVAFGSPDPTPGGPVYTIPGDAPVWPALFVSGAVLLLLRKREIDARPAAVLIVALFAAFTMTPDPLDWHVGTAATRLALQAAPALLLAAIHRMTAPGPPPAPPAPVSSSS